MVKSTPELWAEVSDLEALARHLAEFGEITITRVEPETKVAWEGEHASGTVELTASGWGTKVRLTAKAGAVKAKPEPLPVAAEPEQLEDPLPAAAAEPVADPLPAAPEPVAGIEEVEGVVAPAARKGWRFWRRDAEAAPPEAITRPAPVAPSAPAVPPEPEPVAIDPGPPVPAPDPVPPTPTPEPGPPAPPDPNPPQIAFDPERTEAVLTGVLDTLGQAHHRPYSRS